ncbi:MULTISPECIES: hypothetical protein [unclassified Rathayibacter]|uniref:hypothetical protein n=1 Tax=unclassified Rathayibacter TaxID=2609250 RepID=UPI001FB348F5|nr:MULTISPECIES: hypothetical protein [unclassified Rathayibacter]MCJ1674375.1 hypothetical protein [Rathayibacter sp. VKM Ac-2929]MCJ1684656.1 hypothetical protein [Rathayibacter sp. VKM Ac-2928]
MTNDDSIPTLPRLLLALARTGLEPRLARDFGSLAEPLARCLPLPRLALALVRLRRHLRSGGKGPRADHRPSQSAGASSSTACRR